MDWVACLEPPKWEMEKSNSKMLETILLAIIMLVNVSRPETGHRRVLWFTDTVDQQQHSALSLLEYNALTFTEPWMNHFKKKKIYKKNLNPYAAPPIKIYNRRKFADKVPTNFMSQNQPGLFLRLLPITLNPELFHCFPSAFHPRHNVTSVNNN